MLTTLRSRLWLTYALLIVTALGVVMLVLVLYLLRNPLLYRQTLTKLKTIESVILTRQNEFVGLPERELQQILTRADANFDVRLVLFDAHNMLLFDTRAEAGQIALPRLEALRNNSTLRDDSGQYWVYTLSRLENGQRLMAAVPRPKVKILTVLRDELLPPFWGAGGIALVLSLLLAFGMARWIADPLQRMLTAAREMPAQVADVPVRGPQEVRDLTQAFNEMILRVQTMQQVQREFVANVSHELKTPLTSIQGFAQALLEGAAETPAARQQAAQIIYDEAGRMHRMALELLDLARLDSGIAEMNIVQIDLAALLRNLREKFALQAQEEGIVLQVGVADLPMLMGDGDRLAQVFGNLIDNGLKHTSRGGTIRLSAEVVASGVNVSVTDSGEGIPPQALPHIFERFYQADPSRKVRGKHSSGLGLAIANEIVGAHGGKITARSELGVGTTFTVWLPLFSPD
ncbi:MAG: HAMP domain-containing histidine kinase, partial [Anaerolineales bacterium]|nr:HAMP domain-containing histidine kinase [Anaerolineales bacterium]